MHGGMLSETRTMLCGILTIFAFWVPIPAQSGFFFENDRISNILASESMQSIYTPVQIAGLVPTFVTNNTTGIRTCIYPSLMLVSIPQPSDPSTRYWALISLFCKYTHIYTHIQVVIGNEAQCLRCSKSS